MNSKLHPAATRRAALRAAQAGEEARDAGRHKAAAYKAFIAECGGELVNYSARPPRQCVE
jgi:hypothetical protein